MNPKHILVIDDESAHRLMVGAVMKEAGWSVSEAHSGEKALEMLRNSLSDTVRVILLDVRLPGLTGHEVLDELHALYPRIPVVMLTAYGTVGSAVEAMKRGAFDYLTKPADNDELVTVAEKALAQAGLLRENHELKRKLSRPDPLAALTGVGPAMRALKDFILQAGPSEGTVLILGESGTGKELVADALHDCSERADKPLVKVNCAALPGHLLESELFGYCKGAFTGAVKDKPGRFQLAHGGTLFLDEVGEMPLDLQAKLLRALQERIIEPLGSVSPVSVDVRILAATNRDLLSSVRAGTFREDLYFRLNVLEMTTPPLRERREDIPHLVSVLLDKVSARNRKDIRGISPDLMEVLLRYDWPGNVRELENVLERAVILGRSDILGLDTLPARLTSPFVSDSAPLTGRTGFPGHPPATSAPDPQAASGRYPAEFLPNVPAGTGTSPHPNGPTFSGAHALAPREPGAPGSSSASEDASPLDAAERDALVRALTSHHGHRERTANALGISRRTLQYKLKKYGLIRRMGDE